MFSDCVFCLEMYIQNAIYIQLIRTAKVQTGRGESFSYILLKI